MGYKISALTAAGSAPQTTDLFEISRVNAPYDSKSITWANIQSAFTTGFSASGAAITNDVLTGKAGGQTFYGGTASGENLTIHSTAHATKGKILFGTSAYDEVNNRLGLGLSNPQTTAHFYKTSGEVLRVATGAFGDPKISFYDDTFELGWITTKRTDGNKMFFGNGGVETFRISGANVGLNHTDGNALFYINNSSLTYSLVVDGGGANAIAVLRSGDKVGIGTTSAEQKLDVLGVTQIRRNQDATGGGTLQPSNFFQLQSAYWDGAASQSTLMKLRADAVNTSGLMKLGFYNNSDTEIMHIKSDGIINMSSLPTSSAGLASGDLWNNSNVINIV